MLYIHNKDIKYMLYQDLCEEVIKFGIPRTKVYLYLAIMNITSAKTRVNDDIFKIAIRGKEVINTVDRCKCCDNLIFSYK